MKYETNFTLYGVDLEADVMDPDFQEKVEQFDDLLEKDIDKADTLEKNSEVMRAQAEAYKRFIDGVFGEGTSKKMFGDKNNLNDTTDAYLTIAEFFKTQRESFLGDQGARIDGLGEVKGNRAERRAAKKGKK